ncbi:hypothetical protein P170DRAFT_390298 [Aspergillus steynii IBT 23096]|uniref:Mmc1 C-terminal domain-containing protein n=1 Tax=Aspergillus steynii IBT 23096 TaxID=1392250 RepID=A0A2I2FZ93_9EURO|nr:uncharacterized protein P170DRAFT_390298 [Aspergillus steynii IBT 23096]PLB45948.1 hypothetical protein P170DRAFT_390298 [Aspergillus steynii IBT 23096]
MPPKLRGSLSRSLRRVQGSSSDLPCPSCATFRRALSTRRSANISDGNRQSSWAASPRPSTTPTVIHSGRQVPPRLRELYEALNQVKNVATEQVNLSRLQLALRGLESEVPLIRVAVLGLDDASSARRLVRLLLADPLNPRENWEDALDAYEADTSRGLLIRYGEVSESIPNNLLPTISVPSSILKQGNLEILVSSLGADTELPGTRFTAETFLVPTVTIQTSHSGRHNVVRYPVHRAIVCGRGVDGLLAYSNLVARSDLKKETGSVYGAIELAASDPKKHNDRVAFVDIDQAEDALGKFRESVQNASLYERGWNGSGVQPVVDWLAALRADKDILDPSLRSLITSLVDAAETGVDAQQAIRAQQQQEESVSDLVRGTMDRSVTEWAENAHSELRSSLEEGFASKQWRDLAWWKLFWHVDDVGMITSEILEKNYLRRAEKEVIWTAGKFQQAGLLDAPQQETNDVPAPKPDTEISKDASPVSTADAQSPPTSDVPWPTQITTSRNQLLDTKVPSLQAMAQGLVAFSITTTSLTSVLSALTYVSFPSTSIYETCTVAAVGLIYSLRRQQRKWDWARTFWENEVREDGRTALRETEEELRTLVQEGGRRIDEASETQARETVERARKALEDVK